MSETLTEAENVALGASASFVQVPLGPGRAVRRMRRPGRVIELLDEHSLHDSRRHAYKMNQSGSTNKYRKTLKNLIFPYFFVLFPGPRSP